MFLRLPGRMCLSNCRFRAGSCWALLRNGRTCWFVSMIKEHSRDKMQWPAFTHSSYHDASVKLLVLSPPAKHSSRANIYTFHTSIMKTSSRNIAVPCDMLKCVWRWHGTGESKCITTGYPCTTYMCQKGSVMHPTWFEINWIFPRSLPGLDSLEKSIYDWSFLYWSLRGLLAHYDNFNYVDWQTLRLKNGRMEWLMEIMLLTAERLHQFYRRNYPQLITSFVIVFIVR